MAIDVVYTLGPGSRWNNGELRYSMRALKKNFSELGRVFVVGYRPKWLSDAAIHIDVADIHKHNKDANIIDKVVAACRAGVSDQFIRSSDDELILIPSNASDIKPYHGGTLRGRPASFWSNVWKKRLRATSEMLSDRGFECLHFDIHIPNLYDREAFLRAAESTPYRETPFTINTMYFNQAGVVDPPRLAGQKVTFESAVYDTHKIRKRIAGKRFLGYNDRGLTGSLKQVLQEMFPEPSPFEKDRGVFMPVLDDTVALPTVVAVIGTPRAGTSCTAGLIHMLGVSMGTKLRPARPRNPKGFFEDIPLRQVCSLRKGPKRIKRFRAWAVARAAEGIVGAKDGKLCKQIPQIVKAWSKLKVVAVDRPISEVVDSMQKAGSFKRMNRQRMESMARDWTACRDADLSRLKVDCLRVNFRDVVNDTQVVIDRIVEFLGISPTAEQRQAAMEFVDPTLYHNRECAIEVASPPPPQVPVNHDYCEHRLVCPYSRDGNQQTFDAAVIDAAVGGA